MRIGALDLGSNSFHLLVVEAHPDGSFEPLLREKEMLRLGDEVARSGRIGDEAATRAVETVKHLYALAESVGVDEMVACATSALREAENGSDVADRIELETGVDVRVVSGQQEAELIFRAVRASVLFGSQPVMALDLGGGSLEVMVGDGAGLRWSSSLKLGVGRLTTEFMRSDPPSESELRRLRSHIDATLATAIGSMPVARCERLVVTSGTFCALARAAAGLARGTTPGSINQLTVTAEELGALEAKVLELPACDRQRLPGIDARRADLLPAGALVLGIAMEKFGFSQLTVSEGALREGIVLDVIARHDPVDWSDEPGAIRGASVVGLARRCGWEREHAHQVAALSLSLFDALRPIHGLDDGARELLEYGALLHDIGQHVSTEGHDKHGAYLIEHGRLRGFAPDEVATIACLARFHRRGSPKPSFPPFASLDDDGRRRAITLVALLSVADALDRGHRGVVEGVSVALSRRAVGLAVEAHTDVDLELWAVRRKRALFERVFDCRLEAVGVAATRGDGSVARAG